MAMMNAVERGRSGERYIASNDYVTLEQLAQTVSKVSGVPIPTRRIPFAVLNLVAHVGDLVSHITGTQPPLSVTALKAMNRRHEVSAAKTIRELGVTFRPFEETIRDTANWFLANGYVHSAVQMQPASA